MKVDPRAISAYQNTVNLSERAGRVKGLSHTDAGKSKAPTAPAGSADATRVTISPEARQLAVGAAQGAQAPTQSAGVDAAKVAALKEKIANGSLNLDSHAIAQRLVDVTG